LVFRKNDGLQNQYVVYVQKGLDGVPQVLLDPNKLSGDGTTHLGTLSVSRDGHYAAYGLQVGGSDWQEIHVLDVNTKKDLTDDLKWLKAGRIGWQGEGFYYSRFDAPKKATS